MTGEYTLIKEQFDNKRLDYKEFLSHKVSLSLDACRLMGDPGLLP